MGDRTRFTIIQQGDGNTAQQVNGPAVPLGDPVADREAMAKFIAAASGALAALDLSPEAREEAERAVAAMGEEAADDTLAQERRRVAAAALWRVVEGAAGNALGAALLGLWHP
jgi:hypothetical protein